MFVGCRSRNETSCRTSIWGHDTRMKTHSASSRTKSINAGVSTNSNSKSCLSVPSLYLPNKLSGAHKTENTRAMSNVTIREGRSAICQRGNESHTRVKPVPNLGQMCGPLGPGADILWGHLAESKSVYHLDRDITVYVCSFTTFYSPPFLFSFLK